MITVRHIERLWNLRSYERLFRELVANRTEGSFRFELEGGWAIPTAAMAIIRLEELCQNHVALYSRLLRAVLAGQDADGGWGDPLATAICIKALRCCRGDGIAVDRGLIYLANLQKTEGIWPNVPLRRMPADPYVSAFILFQLGDSRQFRDAVRFLDAIDWFEHHKSSLDAETQRMWEHSEIRCRLRLLPERRESLLWA